MKRDLKVLFFYNFTSMKIIRTNLLFGIKIILYFLLLIKINFHVFGQGNTSNNKISKISASNDYIKFYQNVFSDLRGHNCPMFPSCSTYGSEVFNNQNGFNAFLSTSDRLMRCGHEPSLYHLSLVNNKFKLLDLPSNQNKSSYLAYNGWKKYLAYGDYSKDAPNTKFIKNLINNEAYTEALLEIRRLEYFEPNEIDLELFTNKLIAFKGLRQFDKGVYEYEFSKNELFKINSQVLFQVAVMYLELHNLEGALKYTNLGISKSNNQNDLTDFFKIQGIINSEKDDWDAAEHSFEQVRKFDEYTYNNLTKILSTRREFKNKNEKIAGILSIIPGGGYLYTGHKTTGITSFLVNGLLGYATYTNLKTENYGTAIFTGLFNLSFYIGNLQGSIKAAHRYNSMQKDNLIDKIRRTLNI